jgi:AcrR family transcriptional regulator
MLDACAQLVDEVGCDGLTTTLLAERAQVAIGSVYQFFPDKQAVVRALVVRNLEAYLDRLGGRLGEATFGHWWEAVDAAIEEYIAMHRNVPGFRTLRFGDIGERYLLTGEADSSGVIAEHLVSSPRGGLAGADEPAVRFALQVAVQIFDALVTMAFRRDLDGDPAVLAECRTITREYLVGHLPA